MIKYIKTYLTLIGLILAACGDSEPVNVPLDIPEFIPLGELPGGEYFSEAHGVSSDGSTVIGQSRSANSNPETEAFIWRQNSGLQGLGSLPGGLFRSQAISVSANGGVVVGNATSGAGVSEAFRWTPNTSMIRIGDLSGGEFSSGALSVSSDGAIVVGWGSSDRGYEGAKWLSADGPDPMGDLSGGAYRSAAALISDDGTLVVGTGNSEEGAQVVRWTNDGAVEGLGDLPGGDFYSEPFGMTPFGLVIVGESASRGGTEAFRWSSSDGMIGLGDLTGGDYHSAAFAVSDDGFRIAGMATSSRGEEAVIWEDGFDMKPLSSMLLGLGITSHEGWYLQRATGISGDGTVVVGYGLNPDGDTEAWLIRNLKRTGVPETPAIADQRPRETPPTEDLTPVEAPPAARVTTAKPAPSVTASDIASAGRRRERQAVEDMVNNWAKAWSDQNINAYLGFYATDFAVPDGQSREAWETIRFQRLNAPSFIKITVSDLKVSLVDDNTATATFAQQYESNSYKDRVEKIFQLKKSFGAWQIVSSESRDLPDPRPPIRRRRSTFAQMNGGQTDELPPPPPELAAPPAMNVGPFIDPTQIDIQLVTSVILTWAQAWSNQDPDTYLSLYSTDFEAPDNQSFDSWKQIRRQRILEPGFVDVTVSDIDVKMIDGLTAEVSFLQSYQSDTYGNRTRNILSLKKQDGRWKIYRE